MTAPTETGQAHTGGMIALVPADPDALAVPGGDPAAEMHMTLVYLGDDVSTMDDAVRTALLTWAAEAAQRREPIDGMIFAHAVWNPDDGLEGDAHKEPATVYEIEPVERWDLVELADWARYTALDIMGRAMFPTQHDPFKPHVTAGYNLDVSKLSATGPVVFDRIRIALGNDVTDFPLTGYPDDDYCYPDGCYSAKNTITAAAGLVDPTDKTPVTEDGTPVPKPQLSVDNGVPLTFPVIIIEGMETGDGRFIVPGSLGHRALPLPILAQTKNPDGGQGHDGATVVGRLDTLTRTPGPEVISKETGLPFPEGTFVWSGTGFGDPEEEGIIKAQKGYLTGNSADLSDVSADFVFDEEDDDPFAGPTQIRMTGGKIAATTLVPIPAFADAYVQFDGADVPVAADLDESLVASASWTSDAVGDMCGLCAAGVPAPVEEKQPMANRTLPPAHAFADPVLDGPTPLTLDEDSIPGFIEVTGHLAAWNTCHTGIVNECVVAPKSAMDYGYFHSGAVKVRDADRVFDVAAGHITMGEGGHAGTKLSAADAAAHYDNVNTVVADVAAGEDEFGIWVHGVMRTTATPEQVDALRASPLSGDWRKVGRGLELVAALAVNSGGFPVPRARVASGAPYALVAAGALPVATSTTDTGAKASPNEDEQAQAERIAALVVDLLQKIDIDNEDAPADKVEEEALALAGEGQRARLLLM
jgi:hypothetical protein